MKTKIVSCHTADSKPVKQEVNGTVILPPLEFPGETVGHIMMQLSHPYLLIKIGCFVNKKNKQLI
jgi:hypothetical protein